MQVSRDPADCRDDIVRAHLLSFLLLLLVPPAQFRLPSCLRLVSDCLLTIMFLFVRLRLLEPRSLFLGKIGD